MATATTESSPFLSDVAGNRNLPSTSRPNRTTRTVTFNPTTQISSQSGSSSSTSGAPLRPAHSPSATLSPQTSNTQHAQAPREPMLSAFNSKLRRRNSHGAPLPTIQPAAQHLGPRVGAQRTTKKTEKLKLLPNPEFDADGPDEESGRDVYSQFTRIKDPTARRDAARLGKADRDRLPRVTAYCTAQGYRLDGVVKWMKSRQKTRGACPKLFDECLYSWWDYGWLSKRRSDDVFNQNSSRSPIENHLARVMKSSPSPRLEAGRRYSDSAVEVEEQKKKDRRENLIDLQDEMGQSSLEADQAIMSPTGQDDAVLHSRSNSNDVAPASLVDNPVDVLGPEQNDPSEPQTYVEFPEVFVFDYGTVVIWGMTVQQEQRFLNDIAKFAQSPLPAESIQTEDFNFYYTREYQARIYNDFISLRDPKNNMTKLAISHALSQSVKTSLFEDLVSETIETTSPLPALIAQTGSVNLTRRQLNMQIGELFILKINIHLQGSVLDSPELMWAEPHLEPIYAAVRSYLEIGQRVTLLTERLDVIADLLAVLREQGSTRHGEVLEWIVIVLIAAEIVVAAVNILVDLWAGVD